MENKEILVHTENLELFKNRISEINERFSKKGLPIINFKCIKEPETIEVEEPVIPGSSSVIKYEVLDNLYKFELSSEFNQTNISGVDVKFEGVVDLIDQDEESKVFKLDNPNIFKYLDKCECDECHKAIGRNKYIVFSKKGKEVESRKDLLVFGTTCAKNYFPFNIESYLGVLDVTLDCIGAEFDEHSGASSFSSNNVDIKELFNVVGTVTNNFSVYMKSDEGVHSTRSQVENILADKKQAYLRFKEPKVSWKDMEEWLKVAYGKEAVEKDYSEFMLNIHSTMFDSHSGELRKYISIKQIGLAVYSFVGAKRNHDKELERIAKVKAYKDGTKDEYFGQIGAKFEKELTFEKAIGFESCYGFTYLLFFRDDEGHVFKWSTGNSTYHCWCKTNGKDGDVDYEIGQKYLIKGTIKDHSEYKDIKQTAITRCKVLKDHYESHVFSKNEINVA